MIDAWHHHTRACVPAIPSPSNISLSRHARPIRRLSNPDLQTDKALLKGQGLDQRRFTQHVIPPVAVRSSFFPNLPSSRGRHGRYTVSSLSVIQHPLPYACSAVRAERFRVMPIAVFPAQFFIFPPHDRTIPFAFTLRGVQIKRTMVLIVDFNIK